MADAEDDEHGNVDRRDPDQMRRDAQRAARVVTAQRVLEAADIRDVEADARDRIAVERDRAADRTSFTSPGGNSGYGADLPARRHAALDRRDAKGDRSSAAQDRAVLSAGAGADAPEQAGPVDIGPVHNEPVENEPAENEPAENEPAENASTKNAPGEHRP